MRNVLCVYKIQMATHGERGRDRTISRLTLSFEYDILLSYLAL